MWFYYITSTWWWAINYTIVLSSLDIVRHNLFMIRCWILKWNKSSSGWYMFLVIWAFTIQLTHKWVKLTYISSNLSVINHFLHQFIKFFLDSCCSMSYFLIIKLWLFISSLFKLLGSYFKVILTINRLILTVYVIINIILSWTFYNYITTLLHVRWWLWLLLDKHLLWLGWHIIRLWRCLLNILYKAFLLLSIWFLLSLVSLNCTLWTISSLFKENWPWYYLLLWWV
jgi:hypothetical protein